MKKASERSDEKGSKYSDKKKARKEDNAKMQQLAVWFVQRILFVPQTYFKYRM